MKQHLTYCAGSQTLRLMPQNYMLATFASNRWVVDPDAAISEGFHIKLVKFFRVLEHRFQQSSWKKIKLPTLSKED